MAIRRRAWLAWRFPPGLRRCRVVLAVDASTGDAPHRAANDASPLSRAGLSPAAMSRIEAVSAPMPLAARSAGSAVLVRSSRWRRSSARSPSRGRGWYWRARVRNAIFAASAGSPGPNRAHRAARCAVVSGSGARAQPVGSGQSRRLGRGRLWVGSGDDEIADLIGDAGAMRTRRAQHDPDRPDRLHDPVAALGSRGRLAGERSSPPRPRRGAARAAASASTASDLPRRRRI